ncbi:MAG: ABC transporter ATP-binding protein [Gammaproteobacteria bacterium]|nr:ABC transporter ATP-binding protein [Gammaproteobacteria bacterium]MCP5425772.1 ABC transporter ATP-binding protein [Gammaproteobacteria bacterium]MCP5458617.1 ABC transporter ATP-binding protein [Gammaproteobacteria bacterium]
MPSPVLTTEDLAVGYRGPRGRRRIVAAAISETLRSGELVCLLGPNGAGKSTLLRTLAGMQRPLSGQVRLLGESVHTLAPKILAQRLSVVLTERVDDSGMTVEALTALGRYPYTPWSGRLTAEDDRIVRWALRTVGVLDLASRPVAELSDGERQKALLARALAQEPAVLILDEPTAFLDLPRRALIMDMLRRLTRDMGYAVLLSSHDLDLALRCADRIWLLPLQGTLCAGAPEDLVLNGAVQAAFQSEGVVFDPYAGSFRLTPRARGRVAVRGEGLVRVWTERALERAGYGIEPDSSASCTPQVTIVTETGQSRWRIQATDQDQECHTLYEMIACLQALDSPSERCGQAVET